MLVLWYSRRRCLIGKLRRPLLLVGDADVPHRGARRIHLHRVTRDVYADASRHAVRFPRPDVAVRVARRDEAIVVAAMAAALAAAVARHVAEHLWMFGGERVHRAHDVRRARRRRMTERQRWQDVLFVRTEPGVG